jgi:competence ComEA-like helix-hairpin-helix protein
MKTDGLRQIFKDYFSFSKSERYGMVVLCTILFIAIVINFLIGKCNKPSDSDFSKIKKAIAEWDVANSKPETTSKGKLFAFNPNTISTEELDSLSIPGNIKSNIIKYRQKGGRFANLESVRKLYGMNDSLYSLLEGFIIFDNQLVGKVVKDIVKQDVNPVILSFFDPNSVTLDEAKVLGFNKFQTENILKYRERGGHFKTKNDLSKIYGIDSVFFLKIEPWIIIAESEVAKTDNSKKEYKEELLELNEADSSSLEKLKGIGSVMAMRITRYRDMLGGFYSVNQLKEVYGFTNETFDLIKNKITIDTFKVKKLSLNFSEYEEFAGHPYISGDVAKNIIKYRNKNGSFKACDDLVNKNLIEPDKYERLKPYLKTN